MALIDLNKITHRSIFIQSFFNTMKRVEKHYIHVALNRFAIHVPEDENTIILSNRQVSIWKKSLKTQTYKENKKLLTLR